MYRIIKVNDGTILGAVDKVLYINIGENGCFCATTEDKAIGVAFNSTPYNLFGHNEIEGADTVIVSEFDGGELYGAQTEMDKAVRDADAMNVDHEYRLTLLELGLSEG